MANLTQLGQRFFSLNRKNKKEHPVKLSALWELKAALLAEHYEICREVIAIAKEFGATEREIYYLLEDPRRQP